MSTLNNSIQTSSRAADFHGPLAGLAPAGYSPPMARRDVVSEGRGRTRFGLGIAALLLGCTPASRPATVVIDAPPATASAPPLAPRAAPAAGRAGREGSC